MKICAIKKRWKMCVAFVVVLAVGGVFYVKHINAPPPRHLWAELYSAESKAIYDARCPDKPISFEIDGYTIHLPKRGKVISLTVADKNRTQLSSLQLKCGIEHVQNVRSAMWRVSHLRLSFISLRHSASKNPFRGEMYKPYSVEDDSEYIEVLPNGTVKFERADAPETIYTLPSPSHFPEETQTVIICPKKTQYGHCRAFFYTRYGLGVLYHIYAGRSENAFWDLDNNIRAYIDSIIKIDEE